MEHLLFMMKLFHTFLLCCAVCCLRAEAEVRMVDVVTDTSFADTLKMVRTIKDSSSCRKVVDVLNREADRQEKRWKEACLSGYPTPQEWLRMAECQAKTFGEALERGGNEDSDTLSRLVADGIISSEEEEQVQNVLFRCLMVSKAAVDSLDAFIDGAELPLPFSSDGDSYEKLLAWKFDPEHFPYSESQKERDPILNGKVEESLERCWGPGVMENIQSVLYLLENERFAQLLRRYADRKVEEAERYSKLPPLSPEQWCWLMKQEHEDDALIGSLNDMQLYLSVLEEAGYGRIQKETADHWRLAFDKVVQVWKEKVRKEEGR